MICLILRSLTRRKSILAHNATSSLYLLHGNRTTSIFSYAIKLLLTGPTLVSPVWSSCKRLGLRLITTCRCQCVKTIDHLELRSLLLQTWTSSSCLQLLSPLLN